MMKNKLKINDSKTEFIVFRSPQAKEDFSSLSISVGDSLILQSSKVRPWCNFLSEPLVLMIILVVFVDQLIFI